MNNIDETCNIPVLSIQGNLNCDRSIHVYLHIQFMTRTFVILFPSFYFMYSMLALDATLWQGFHITWAQDCIKRSEQNVNITLKMAIIHQDHEEWPWGLWPWWTTKSTSLKFTRGLHHVITCNQTTPRIMSQVSYSNHPGDLLSAPPNTTHKIFGTRLDSQPV